MAHDVFVSYSAKNKTIADAVCALLESEGIRCWIAPRDVLPGAEYGESIIDAIEQARLMVLVFTADANASPQVRREVERAAHHDVAILPLRLENVLPAKALAFFISNVQWLDALTPPLEPHLKRLAATIRTRLEAMDRRNASAPEPAAAEASQESNRQAPAAAPATAPPPAETHAQQAPALSPHIPQPETAIIAPRLRRIPAWAWGGGVILALVLAGVFAALRSGRHSPAEGFDEKPLADTMKYIQDGLNAIGKLEITANFRNTTNGSNFRYTEADEASNVVADPSQCRISYHWRVWQNGSPQPASDHDSGFNLRDVDDVVLEPWRKWRTDSFADTSSSNLVAISTDPDVTALVLSWKNKATPYDFPFTNALLAVHLADALKHAVKLCGGGSPANASQGGATGHSETPVQPAAQPAPQDAAAAPATMSPSPVRKLFKDWAPNHAANAPVVPGDGASLEDTMKFIQDALSHIGKISFVGSWVGKKDRNFDSRDDNASEISNIVADPIQCRISYDWTYWMFGPGPADYVTFNLRDVQSLVVGPLESPMLEDSNPLWPFDKHDDATYSTDPILPVLEIRERKNVHKEILFTDAGLANRVASALRHAAKLCGASASVK